MAKRFLTSTNLLNLASDPNSPIQGDVYYNTVLDKIKVYDGSQWVVVGGSAITVSSSAPSSPTEGSAWYDNISGDFYIYDGTFWVEVTGVISGGLFNIVEDATPQLGANLDAQSFDITNLDQLSFDTTPDGIGGVGTLVWNDGDGTLDLGLKGGNVTLQLGQEQVARCYNDETTTLTEGTIVYVNGSQGQRIAVKRASASGELSSSKTFGMVTENIASGAEGFVTVFGLVRNLNTSAYTEGAALWLSTTAGQFTETKPTDPNHLVFVGYCVRQHATAGSIFVNPQNGYELDELHDVLLSSPPSNNQALIYESSTSLWKNKTISSDWISEGSSNIFFTDERAQDAIVSAINNGTQTNISITYDDAANALSFNASGGVYSLSGTTNEVEVSSSTGAVTIGLPNDVSISNNLIVGGDLTVNGTTTTLNTAQLLIEDNILTLNSGVTGTPTLNAGIEVERGTFNNVAVRWNETDDQWEYTNDGVEYKAIGSGGGAVSTNVALTNSWWLGV